MPENTDTVTKPGAYVTVPEAAALASLSEPAIRRAVREGRLSAVTVDGGRWLVDRLDLTRRHQGHHETGTKRHRRISTKRDQHESGYGRSRRRAGVADRESGNRGGRHAGAD